MPTGLASRLFLVAASTALLAPTALSIEARAAGTQPQQAASAPNNRAVWTFVDSHDPASAINPQAPKQDLPAFIRPVMGQPLVLDLEALRVILKDAPPEGVPGRAIAGREPLVLVLPDPSGKFQRFAVVNTPLMEPGLQAQFPDWVTLVGQGLDDPHAVIRADLTAHGFRAQILSPARNDEGLGGSWYIDPYAIGDTARYTSYHRYGLKNLHRWACGVTCSNCDHAERGADRGDDGDGTGGPSFISSGTQLRTYRLAVACTGEYAAFFGGTVPLAQAAIVTAINRVTGVYENEVAVRMTLVASNPNVVFTNAATDPYTNLDGFAMLSENQARLNLAPPSGIGSANYDIGHVFSTATGGVASLGSVCVASRKAQGVTGQTSPFGDPFYIDYVAHEMGHQFDAEHSFNSTTGSCGGGNRNASTAYELGSGSTIMSYAGICGSDNIQSNSDAYFHGVSYDEIRTYVTSGSGATCGTLTNTGNNPPTFPVQTSLTIPRSTSFSLSTLATDPDGNPLTYCWEEFALGAAQTIAAADNAASPLTRSRAPVTSTTRFIPALSFITSNSTNVQEELPSLARSTWNWRVTARDNRAGGGGVNNTTLTLSVNASAGPFAVTSQPTSVTWNSGTAQTITWNVANTNIAPINTSQVIIELSTDGGATYPNNLGTFPNNGSATITVPAVGTAAGRIRVRASNNIYFDLANGIITINNVPAVQFSGSGVNSVSDTSGNGNANTVIDPGETAIALTVRIANTGTLAATGVTGTLSTSTPTATIVTASAAYPNVPALTGTADNSVPFIVSVSPTHPCGAPINFSLAIASAQGSGTYTFSLPTGTPGSSITTTHTYAGSVAPIPDANIGGAAGSVVVSGLTGTITDVTVTITGSGCTASTAGLDHTRVSDLIVSLVGPAGTQVQLANSRGGSGANFCSTLFSDAASTAIAGGAAPFTGSFRPEQPLSAFDGLSPNATWSLVAQDLAAGSTGSIRAFSINITRLTPVTCTPPSSGATCPSITTPPTSVLRACGSQPVSFNVVAAGSPTLAYQWRAGTTNLTNSGRFSGVDTPTLTITNPTEADAGNYSVVISNSCSGSPATSMDVQLTVCRADFNCSGSLTVGDIFDFLNAWFATLPSADIDASGALSVTDIFQFLNRWFAGCP
jgi:subtilisin-like proprotein convertase family protein